MKDRHQFTKSYKFKYGDMSQKMYASIAPFEDAVSSSTSRYVWDVLYGGLQVSLTIRLKRRFVEHVEENAWFHFRNIR